MKVKLKNSRTWHTIANVSFISLWSLCFFPNRRIHMGKRGFLKIAIHVRARTLVTTQHNIRKCYSSNVNFIELFTDSPAMFDAFGKKVTIMHYRSDVFLHFVLFVAIIACWPIAAGLYVCFRPI